MMKIYSLLYKYVEIFTLWFLMRSFFDKINILIHRLLPQKYTCSKIYLTFETLEPLHFQDEHKLSSPATFRDFIFSSVIYMCINTQSPIPLVATDKYGVYKKIDL